MATERQVEQGSSGTNALQHPNVSGSAAPGVPADRVLEVPAASGIGPSAGQADSAVARIPIEVDVAVPIRKFRVRNLLTLTVGQVIATQWIEGEDMPLGARGAQLAWTEFEVIEHKLAVRITRLV